MKKKYLIVRLDDNNYWGFGWWTSEVTQAQFFDDRAYPEDRIKNKDLIPKDAVSEVWQQGKVIEVREVWVKQ